MILITEDKDLDARIRKLSQHPANKKDPTYLEQVRLVFKNRTIYPYPDGKADLAEFIGFYEKRDPENPGIKRFQELYHRLLEHNIIPDDIAIHAKELAEERTNGIKTPAEVVNIMKIRVKDIFPEV